MSAILSFLKSRKKEILVAIFCFIVFTVMIFPYSDLSDLVTEKVAQQTQNQVFLSFENLGLSFLPPGVSLTDVIVETAFAPPLRLEHLALAPSITGLLAFKPGFVAKAKGLFNGDISLSYKSGKKIDDDTTLQTIDLDMSQASLKELTHMAKLPLEVRGVGDIEIEGDFDPNFREQPDSEYRIIIQKLKLPSSTVPTPLGPLNIPTIEMEKVHLQGRLAGGELIIEKGELGETKNDIHGTITGKIKIQFVRRGSQIAPIPGAYDLKLDLKVSRQAEQSFGLFLSFVDQYKQSTGSGSRYPLHLKGQNFNSPPRIEFLR